MGADPSGFLPNYRYVLSDVGGRCATTSEGLSDDTPVGFNQKIGSSTSFSFTLKQDEKPEVNHSFLVFAPRNTVRPNNPGDGDVLITAFPGSPSKQDGYRRILSREARDSFDRRECTLFRKLSERAVLPVGLVKKIRARNRDGVIRDFNLNVVCD